MNNTAKRRGFSRRNVNMIGVCLGVLISLCLPLTIGVSGYGLGELWGCMTGACENPLSQTIVLDIRLPRVLLGFVAGFALASAGALMQNVTRNPLADPYLFGIISGAGLGATLSTLMPTGWQWLSLPLAAFLGSLLAVALVMMTMLHNRWRKPEHLLLAGVAVSFLLSSMTSFILFFSEAFAANRVIFWLMGSLSRADIQAVFWVLPTVFIAIGVALLYRRQLDALLLSDESAKTLGVAVDRVRLIILLLCAAMCAVVVSYCGGIAFVGLMIPHIARRFLGFTTARLLIGAGLLGGCFLVWVDVFARTVLTGQEIPIGVVTSVVGSVFFLSLMRKM